MSSPLSRDERIAAIVRATADLGTARGSHTAGVAERLGLAATDVDVLRLLADEGAMPVGRIGELTTLTTGATTRLIDRLEQAGYVRREPDPADRRRVIVAPVPERVALVTAAFDPIDEAIRDALADHSPDALADVHAYLDACLAALRSGSPASVDGAGPSDGGAVNAPIASATAGRLVFVTGAPHVTIRSDPTPPENVSSSRRTARRSSVTDDTPPRNSIRHGSPSLSRTSVASRRQCPDALTRLSPMRTRQSNQAKRGKRIVTAPSRTLALGMAPAKRAR